MCKVFFQVNAVKSKKITLPAVVMATQYGKRRLWNSFGNAVFVEWTGSYHNILLCVNGKIQYVGYTDVKSIVCAGFPQVGDPPESVWVSNKISAVRAGYLDFL